MSDEISTEVTGEAGAEDLASEVVTEESLAAETSPDWGARVAEWGGEDSIAEAVDFVRSMQTVEGVKFFLGEGAKALRDLGIPATELAKLIAAEEAAAEASSSSEFDPDAPLTHAQYMELERKRSEEMARERTETEFRVAVENNVKSGLEAVGITDQKVGQIVAQYADQYVNPADYGDQAKIAAAIKKGYDDFQQVVKQQHEAYLTSKAGDAAGSPTPLVGGQTPGGSTFPEPKSLDEAIARRKKEWADKGIR